MPDVMVTGSNGFIGSHLVEELLNRGHQVWALIRPTSDIASLVPLSERHGDRLHLVLGDVRQPGRFGSVMARCEYIYHLAAVLLGASEAEFRDTNVNGTRQLLAQIEREHHPSLKRVLITSSQAAAGPSPTPQPIDETREPHPVSWYGRSKVDVERAAREAAARGLPVSIVRPVAVYGDREMDLSRAMFPVVSLGIRPRIGLRSKTLTLVHVRDVVLGMIAVAEAGVTIGRTYFLANPSPNSDTEVTDTVARAIGKRHLLPLFTPPPLLWPFALLAECLHLFTRERPMTTRDKLREVGQRHWAATAAVALRDVGWRASVRLDTGMASAVTDWRSRVAAGNSADRLPTRDRAIMTYCLAVLCGVLVEGLALLGKWYAFNPRWLVFVIIVGVFGGVMGTLTYVSVRWTMFLQFLAGAAVGTGAELLNALWLHRWAFSDPVMQRLPDLAPRVIVLGLPAGLLPVVITATLRAFYRRRLRIG